MSERRSVMAPPEITNGSTRGRVSSYKSARAMCIGGQIEKVQFPFASLQHALRFQSEHSCDHTVRGMEHQLVERALGTRSGRGGVLLGRQLEEGVELDALAAATGVFEDHAARGDVAGPREVRKPWGDAVQDAQIALAQRGTTISDALLGVEQAVEHHERIRTGGGPHHLDLKVVVKARVHHLHRQTYRRLGTNARRHLAQPAKDLRLLSSERITGQGRGKILLEQ